ncbi:alpha-2A adrenergic receptor-like [Diadema setosum]|uniref:alpha-2A adrenergic receptor-like n=1 Tax=Diadema setosum TaxID=31175 RepID=UPI003B3B5807
MEGFPTESSFTDPDPITSGSIFSSATDGYNETTRPTYGRYGLARMVICSLLALLVIILIVIGNIMVCIAVFRERALKAVQNWFLVSLAASDLMVGVLIMPLGVVNEMLGHWIFGNLVCLLWLVLDVLACTASILNLCLISIDRYCSITRPIKHAEWRQPGRVRLMIFLVWGLSMVISVPPLFGWRTENKPDENNNYKCVISDNIGYILYSTMGSFYIPAFIMVIVYWKIWRAARKRARAAVRMSKRANGKNMIATEGVSVDDRTNFEGKTYALIHKTEPDIQMSTLQVEHIARPVPSACGTSSSNPDGDSTHDRLPLSPSENTLHPPSITTSTSLLPSTKTSDHSLRPDTPQLGHRPSRVDPHEVERQKRRLAQSRDRRATIVLGVIMGTFLACWYPFFQLYVISALCGKACKIPTLLFDFFFWIGYCNSALNPIIYTIFNRDFRRAFKKMLGIRRRRR